MKIKGFTPCFDTLIVKYNEVGGKRVPGRGMKFASVYGKVWRYEQMKDKKCKASQSRIAKELGMTRQAVNACLGILKDDKYIEAEKGGRTISYTTTGKADMVLGAEDELSPPDTPPVMPEDKSCNPSVQQPVAPDDTKILVKETSEETKEDIKDLPFNAGIKNAFVFALAEVTGLDSKLNYGRLAKDGKKYHSAGYTPDQIITAFGKGSAWYKQHWKGKKGEKPSTSDIMQNIKDLLSEKKDTHDPDEYVGGELSEFIEY